MKVTSAHLYSLRIVQDRDTQALTTVRSSLLSLITCSFSLSAYLSIDLFIPFFPSRIWIFYHPLAYEMIQ